MGSDRPLKPKQEKTEEGATGCGTEGSRNDLKLEIKLGCVGRLLILLLFPAWHNPRQV